MKFTRINKDKFAKFYDELRQIDEFHADFHPTVESKNRMREIIAQLPVTYRNNQQER